MLFIYIYYNIIIIYNQNICIIFSSKMMEYKVVQEAVSYGTFGIEFEVTRLMQEEGWKPKGGVSFSNGSYLQAMVRNVPLPPLPQQRSSAVVGSSSEGGGSSRKKSKRRLRKTQYRSKRNNQKSRKL
jgi:hypothetical protein